MKYEICIVIKHNQYRTIEAENEDEAKKKALQDWNDGKLFEEEGLSLPQPELDDVFVMGWRNDPR